MRPPSRAERDGVVGTGSDARPARTALLAALGVLTLLVLKAFLSSIAWAAVLAYTAWPLHRRLRSRLGGRATASAALVTAALGLSVVVPLIWLLAMLRAEAMHAYASVTQLLLVGPPELPPWLRAVPWLGDTLQRALEDLARSPRSVTDRLGGIVQRQSGVLLGLLGDAGRNAVKLGLALVTALFLLRDGEALVSQLRRALLRVVGAPADRYLAAMADTTRAVVNGLVVSAMAQALLAGAGYWAAGVQAPVLLAAITGLFAMIPWGTPLVWVPVSLWLVANGDHAAGIGLFLWGLLAVSWIDNLLRPLLISGGTRIPLPIVMFGVLGGGAAFGLIGLFVGPVVLAIALAVWREWLDADPLPSPSP